MDNNSGNAAENGGTTMFLRCRSCGAQLTANKDQSELVCPYCGSKEMFLDSDAVKAEKIRSQAYLDAEKERLRYEAEMKEKQMRAEERAEFSKGRLKKFIIAFFVICLCLVFVCFVAQNIGAAVIGMIQMALLVFAFLLGMQYINLKQKWIKTICIICALVLIIPLVFMLSKTPEIIKESRRARNEAQKESARFEWPSSGLAAKLPKPSTDNGMIYDNAEDHLRVLIYDLSEKELDSYISAVKNKGFKKVITEKSSEYLAYDDAGNGVRITYNKEWKPTETEIEMYSAYDSISWPTIGLAAKLPVPSSSKGKIICNSATYGFEAVIAETDKAAYEAYVKACQDAGFIVDYDSDSDYYSASNEDGDELSIISDPNGFTTMEIWLYPADDEPEEEPQPDESTEEEPPAVEAEPEKVEEPAEAEPEPEESRTNPSVSDSAIRPEVKASIDAYEAYVDSYCDFMKNYDPTDMSSLSKYLDFVTKLTENEEAFEAMDDSDWTTAEVNYYIEVLNRCNTKILQVAYSM